LTSCAIADADHKRSVAAAAITIREFLLSFIFIALLFLSENHPRKARTSSADMIDD
jgi:hypothetical protein